MSRSTSAKPKAYQLTHDQLAPDMKHYAGVWVIPEGAEDQDPYADVVARIQQRARAAKQAEQDAVHAQRKASKPDYLRKAIAA